MTLCVEGLGMKEYNGSEALQDFFKVVSLSVDKQDVAYISTLESKKVSCHHPAPGMMKPACLRKAARALYSISHAAT